MVGRTVQAQNNMATQSTAVQYVAAAPTAYYDPMGSYAAYLAMYAEHQYELQGNGMGLQQ